MPPSIQRHHAPFGIATDSSAWRPIRANRQPSGSSPAGHAADIPPTAMAAKASSGAASSIILLISPQMRSPDSRSIPSLNLTQAVSDSWSIPVAYPALKRKKPQDAQGNPRGYASSGIADETHPPRVDVIQSMPRRIVDLAVDIGIKRVEIEIAPPGILGPVGRVCHHRPAAIGLDVFTQAGDLERLTVDHRRDRAEILAVGTLLMPAAPNAASVSSGVSCVDKSRSLIGLPSTKLRTQPPTKRTQPLPPWLRAQRIPHASPARSISMEEGCESCRQPGACCVTIETYACSNFLFWRAFYPKSGFHFIGMRSRPSARQDQTRQVLNQLDDLALKARPGLLYWISTRLGSTGPGMAISSALWKPNGVK